MTFQPDPDPDPSFQIKAQTLDKVLKYAHIPYILTCQLQTDADPDPDFYLMLIWMRIQVTKVIRIYNTGKLTNLACLSLLYSILAGEGGRSTNIS
jgi:hypothetical protein